MVLIILVSPAHTPVEGLLTLVPEVMTAVGLTNTNCELVPAENSKFGPSYLTDKRLPTESSKTILGISSEVVPDGNIKTLLAIRC
jgi:hypothetical protein